MKFLKQLKPKNTMHTILYAFLTNMYAIPRINHLANDISFREFLVVFSTFSTFLLFCYLNELNNEEHLSTLASADKYPPGSLLLYILYVIRPPLCSENEHMIVSQTISV